MPGVDYLRISMNDLISLIGDTVDGPQAIAEWIREWYLVDVL